MLAGAQSVTHTAGSGRYGMIDFRIPHHPRDEKMAVLQNDPETLFLACLKHSLRGRPLPLPERDGVDLASFSLGELKEGEHGIHARREDKYQGRGVGRVTERSLQIEGRRLNVLLSEVARDELGDGGH
jgi:hypothetical protein